MNTHRGGQDLAKEIEIIFGDQSKEWARKRKGGAVKTTGTKKEAMDGGWKKEMEEPWSDMTGKKRGH